MRTSIFIIGTNGVGKSTLAREVASRFGGFTSVGREISVCKDARVRLAGRYGEGSHHGGVDSLNETKCLERIFREAYADGGEVVIAEGSYMNTFGLNLTNAMFTADRHLVVSLFAPFAVIDERILQRSGNRLNDHIVRKAHLCVSSSNKWSEIGVPVKPFDTSAHSTKEMADWIETFIRQGL